MIRILYVFLALVMLGVIVTVHEFGHYLVGRLCGIGILEFNVGFGPKLISWKKNGIQYALRAIPLGGSCMFEGEDERSDNPRAMNNQPVWKRFVTVLAGPFMNFVLAFVVCVVMLDAYYYAEALPVINQVVADMPAAEAGLQAGDHILSVNGTPIDDGQAGVQTVSELIRATQAGDSVELKVSRGGEEVDLSLVPAAVTDEATGETRQQIGIVFDARTYTFGEALKEAGGYMVEITGTMLDSLRRLFFHGEGLEDTAGTVGIIAVVSNHIQEGMSTALWLMFIISLNLGIVNLLPFPALDGGRLLFLIVEAIRRKPIPPEKEGMVHAVGLMLLFGLFIVLTYHDIARLISGGFNGL